MIVEFRRNNYSVHYQVRGAGALGRGGRGASGLAKVPTRSCHPVGVVHRRHLRDTGYHGHHLRGGWAAVGAGSPRQPPAAGRHARSCAAALTQLGSEPQCEFPTVQRRCHGRSTESARYAMRAPGRAGLQSASEGRAPLLGLQLSYCAVPHSSTPLGRAAAANPGWGHSFCKRHSGSLLPAAHPPLTLPGPQERNTKRATRGQRTLAPPALDYTALDYSPATLIFCFCPPTCYLPRWPCTWSTTTGPSCRSG